MTPRLFVYKVVHDEGGAPCVHEDLLTLAICKPMIRSSARVGDLLFGFAADSLSPDNPLVYIARVTGVEDNYYDDPAFTDRPDCIYGRGEDGRFRIRSGARFHADGKLIERDVGAFPEYERARVLISDDFRYPGRGRGSAVDLAGYPAVRALVGRLKQGHRVNHPPDVERELWELQQSVWSKESPKLTTGSPGLGRPAASVPKQPSPPHRGCG